MNAEKYTCAATTECSKVFYFSDAWQMFKTWQRAELAQKIHETWENLSKTPINILKTSVWWTENSVNLSGVSVPNLEIKFNYRVNGHFYFCFECKLHPIVENEAASKASITVLRREIMAELFCTCCLLIMWVAQKELTEQGLRYEAGHPQR